MDAKVIQKYANYTLPELRLKAGFKFRKWIRCRDEGKPCISCGSHNVSDAGHYYSAGHYPELEFNENNVHGQCKKCNMFLSGNLIEYRKGLVYRLGIDEVEKLDEMVARYKQITYKHDRYHLIDIIQKYK
jgi:gamma-glutamylcyclotransferase (GGCT)/AIG2-like uncharacterized protein YtfP